jgi:hypothetical protein
MEKVEVWKTDDGEMFRDYEKADLHNRALMYHSGLCELQMALNRAEGNPDEILEAIEARWLWIRKCVEAKKTEPVNL